MAGKFEIKTERDNDSLFCKQKIRVPGKRFETPIKSINLNYLSPKVELPPSIKGVNEVHKNVYGTTRVFKNGRRIKSLNDIQEDPESHSDFNYKLKGEFNKGSKGDASLCFLEYIGETYPDDESIDFLAFTAHGYSNIVPIPIISGVRTIFKEGVKAGLRPLDDYINYLEKMYEAIDTHNNKPIMGIIPNLTHRHIRKILNFYMKKDIRFFYFDFNSAIPTSNPQGIKQVLSTLKTNEILDESYIHAYNVNLGKISAHQGAIPSKDIITFGYGFNGLGRNKSPMAVQSKKESKDDLRRRQDNRLRLFNKNNYSYAKVDKSIVGDIFSEDSSILLEKLEKALDRKTRDTKIQATYNSEQHGFEANKIKEIISQNVELPIDYVKKKKYIEEIDINQMINLSKDVKSQSSLK